MPDCGGVEDPDNSAEEDPDNSAEVITLQCWERCKTGEISYMVRNHEHLTDVIDWPEGDAGHQLDTHGGLCKDLNGKQYFLEGFNMCDWEHSLCEAMKDLDGFVSTGKSTGKLDRVDWFPIFEEEAFD